MFTNNLIYISETDTRDDYISLNLRLDSRFYEWKEAIGIMQRRIQGRYLDPMKTLVITNPNKDGFAAMALCCLLIETLMQFREGFPETPVRQNKKYYTDFLRNQLGSGFNEKKANRFYNDIRCGILHSAQTKNDTCLTFGSRYICMTKKIYRNNVLMVDVVGMYHAISEYFNKYCEELEDPRNEDLRRNFIYKMDDISNKYEGMGIIDTIWKTICEKNNNIEIRSNVNITKGDIERALCYWPNEKAIKILNKGKYIYPILNLFRDNVDAIIAR